MEIQANGLHPLFENKVDTQVAEIVGALVQPSSQEPDRLGFSGTTSTAGLVYGLFIVADTFNYIDEEHDNYHNAKTLSTALMAANFFYGILQSLNFCATRD